MKRQLSRREKQPMTPYRMKSDKWNVWLIVFWAAALLVSMNVTGWTCYLVLRLIF